jgi:CPA2 family monovalent cation:H+ antiporter-2
VAVGSADISALKDVMVFLGSAGIAVPLFHRLRINPVIGFMLAGIAVGPHGLGAFLSEAPWLAYLTITDQHRVELIGELGVVFLMFMIGLDLAFPRLWSMRRQVFGLGLAQVLLTTVAIGALAMALGQGFGAAAVVGIALSFSSTAIVMQLLISEHRFGTTEGQAAFAVLLCQDLMVVPALFVITVLGAGTGSADMPGAFGLAILKAVVAIGAVLLAARIAVRPLLRMAAGAGNHELFVAEVLLVILGTAVVTSQAGLSMALGAFVAGLVLADTEYRHQVEVDIEPFKGLLLGVFFLAIGLNLDLGVVWSSLGVVLLLTLVILAVKAAVAFAVATPFGLGRGIAAEAALLLAHGGEFTLVVVSLAAAQDLIDPRVAQVVLAATVISMALVPGLAGLGQRISAWLEGMQFTGPVLATSDRDGPVIIGGFGRVGEAVARVLESEDVPYLALEADPRRVGAARKRKLPVFFGDASRADVLQRAGANRAQAFVVTLDDALAVDRMVRAIRREWPDTPIFARAKDWRHAVHLQRLGVADVIPEAVEGSLQLAGRVLDGLGFEEEQIDKRLHTERAYERALHQQDDGSP